MGVNESFGIHFDQDKVRFFAEVVFKSGRINGFAALENGAVKMLRTAGSEGAVVKSDGVAIYRSAGFGRGESNRFCRCACDIEFHAVYLIQRTYRLIVGESMEFAAVVETCFVVAASVAEIFAFAQHFQVVAARSSIFRM